MLPDRVSNPGPLTYESGALPIALRGPAEFAWVEVGTKIGMSWELAWVEVGTKIGMGWELAWVEVGTKIGMSKELAWVEMGTKIAMRWSWPGLRWAQR